MSLKFEANLINQLGKQLPTPVIEKVEIYTDRLSVTLSIYLEATEGEGQILFNQYLKGLKLYCFYVLGDNDTESLIKKQNYKIFNELGEAQSQMYLTPGASAAFATANIDISDSSYLASLAEGRAGTDPVGPIIAEYNNYWGAAATIDTFFMKIDSPNYFMVDIGDMVQSSEQLYSEKGDPIIQYTVTQDINIGLAGSPLNLGHGSDSLFSAIAGELGSMTLFAFTSPLAHDWQSMTSANGTSWSPTLGHPWQVKWKGEYATSPGFLKYRYGLNPALNKVLYVNEFSDVAYEKIFKNPGLLNNEGQNVYVNASGDVFNGTPIRSVNGRYYGDTAIQLQTIEEDFKAFNDSYKQGASKNNELQAVVDSVSYVLESKKEDSNLLYELNQYRKAFPKKSGAGVLPNFYKRFRGLIVASDKRVIQGGVLSAKQIRNTKLIDFRGIGPSGYTLPEVPTYNRVNDFLYWRNALTSHTMYYDVSAESWKGQIHGYIFFDLEKAFRTQSAIAQVFEYDKLVSIFGKEIMRRYYYITRAYNTWYLDQNEVIDEPIAWDSITDTSDLEAYGSLITYWSRVRDTDRFEGVAEYTTVDLISQANSRTPIVKHQVDIGDTENAYLFPRSFDIPSNSPLLDRYNLVCLEFQHLYDTESASEMRMNEYLETLFGNRYACKTEVRCTDKTPDLYEDLAASYKNLFEGDFSTYYTAATEACNYNSLTQKFNTFFSEAMAAEYSSLSVKPWAEMAMAYYLHQDLIHDTFNGDETAIREAVTLTSEQINPETGLLPALESFYAAAKEFYDVIYAPNSELAQSIAARSTDISHVFGPGTVPVPYPDAAQIEAGGTIAAITDLQIPALGWNLDLSDPGGGRSGDTGVRQSLWDQDMSSDSSSKWYLNNLNYYQNWWDGVTADPLSPLYITPEEWRTKVRKAMSDLQNCLAQRQDFGQNVRPDTSTPGADKYMWWDPLYKDMTEYISGLALQIFIHFRVKNATGEINSINISDYISHLAIRQVLEQTNPIIQTPNQEGLVIIADSYDYNNLQIFDPAAEQGGYYIGNGLGIPSETAVLNAKYYPTQYAATKTGWSQATGANAGPKAFYYDAYRRLVVLAYGWYYYEGNQTAPEWTSTPMDFIFEGGWEIPVWADGDPGNLTYPSLEWIRANESSLAANGWPRIEGE